MAITIEKYLQVIPNMTFPDTFIQRVLGKFNIASGTGISDIEQKTLDLSEAEVWFGASNIVSGGGYSKRINNRQITENQISITDALRKTWLVNANDLRIKWGEPVFNDDADIYDASGMWGVKR